MRATVEYMTGEMPLEYACVLSGNNQKIRRFLQTLEVSIHDSGGSEDSRSKHPFDSGAEADESAFSGKEKSGHDQFWPQLLSLY